MTEPNETGPAGVGKAIAPMSQAGGGVLRRLLDLAITGAAGLPPVRSSAAKALGRHQEHERAIDALVRQHVMLAGAQGFVTNLGGLAALAVSLPANLTGVAVVQLRMVAGIAHLRGFDLNDPRVRSAVMLCLLGSGDIVPRVAGRELAVRPLLVATAPVFDADLDRAISEKVLNELLAVVGGRRAAALVARRIPIVGSGVGMAADGFATQQVARFARAELVSRRRA